MVGSGGEDLDQSFNHSSFKLPTSTHLLCLAPFTSEPCRVLQEMRWLPINSYCGCTWISPRSALLTHPQTSNGSVRPAGGPVLQMTPGLIRSRMCVCISHSPSHCRVMDDFREKKEAERSLFHRDSHSYMVF